MTACLASQMYWPCAHLPQDLYIDQLTLIAAQVCTAGRLLVAMASEDRGRLAEHFWGQQADLCSLQRRHWQRASRGLHTIGTDVSSVIQFFP